MSRPASGPRPGLLHARARHLPGVLVALVALTAFAAWLGPWLTARSVLGPADASSALRLAMVVLLPVVLAVLACSTLYGADLDLDRTAARLDVRWRAVHGLLAGTLTGAVLAVGLLTSPATYGAAAAVRNTAGLVGMVLLAVTLLPPVLAWVPALGYGVMSYLVGPRSPGRGAPWWAWVNQPGGLDASWVVAAGLLAAGVLAYACRGPSRR